MLEDLIMAATNEALRKVEDEAAKAMGKLTGGLTAAWAEDFRSDGLLQRIHQSVDRGAVPSAWHRCENSTATGLSYYEYAGRPGKTAGRFDHRSKIPRQYCKECCQTLTDKELCPICANVKRDHNVIMVVETTQDLAAYEKTGKYDGVYHVLHGAISPMLGIGPDDIRLKELMTATSGRCQSEVIVATNSRPGRRDNGHVHQQADQADRYQGDADCKRRSGGRRSGKY